MIDTHLIKEKEIWPKKYTYIYAYNYSEFLIIWKYTWNIMYMYQILSIETLQVMEPTFEKKIENPNWSCAFIMIFQRYLRYKFKRCKYKMWLFILWLHPQMKGKCVKVQGKTPKTLKCILILGVKKSWSLFKFLNSNLKSLKGQTLFKRFFHQNGTKDFCIP